MSDKKNDRDRLNNLPTHAILTLTESAILLDCDTQTVSSLIKDGTLTASQIGRSYKITKQSIVALVESGYSVKRQKLRVIDGGKTKTGKRKCQKSTNAVRHGTLTIPTHKVSEYEKALELK